jgi:phage shock protein C
MKRLYRSNNDVVIAGVCSGVAEYFNVDPVIVRILWAIMVVFGGTGLLAYIICAIVIPKRPLDDVGYEFVSDENQTHGGDPSSREPRKGVDVSSDNARLIIGLGFIGLGALLFFRQMLPWFDFSLVLPVILILIGGLIVMKGRGD